MTPNRLLLLLLATPIAACTDDIAEEPGDVATVESSLASAGGDFGWFYGGNIDVDIGSGSNLTCFMTGVKGSLKGYYGTGTGTQPYIEARAGVRLIDNRWRVQTKQGYGGGIAVKVHCISNVQNRRFLGWNESWPTSPVVGQDVTEDSACFLTEIAGTGWGWMAYLENQPNPPPGVSINISNGKAWITGSLVPNSNEVSSGRASGVCVDIRGLTDWKWTATGPGLATLPLPDPGHTACGFQSIAGVFDGQSQGSSPDGLWLDYLYTPAWNVKLTSSAFIGRPYCIK